MVLPSFYACCACVLVVVAAAKAQIRYSYPELNLRNCAEMPCGTRPAIKLLRYVPALDVSCVHSFDPDSYYICPAGIWVAYEEANYLGRAHILGNLGPPLCTLLDTKTLKSFRYAGRRNQTSMSTPSLMLFESEGYHGQDHKLFESSSNLNVTFSSFILIGTYARLYTQLDWQGSSVCVQAPGKPIEFAYSANVTNDYYLEPGQVRSIEFTSFCN